MGSSWKTTRTDDLQGSVGYQICYYTALQSFTAFIWYNNHNSIFTFTTTRLVPNRTTANPMISKNCVQYWYSSQRKTSWIKWLEQLCQALKTYPWNWLGALIETLLIIVCTSLQKMKQSSAHHCIIQTKDLGSNYGTSSWISTLIVWAG